MTTSGQAVKYKGSIDCAMQIMKNEGAGANILSERNGNVSKNRLWMCNVQWSVSMIYLDNNASILVNNPCKCVQVCLVCIISL